MPEHGRELAGARGEQQCGTQGCHQLLPGDAAASFLVSPTAAPAEERKVS